MKYFLLLNVCFISSIGSFCQAQNPTLWGMTYLGGPNNFGTLFSYNISTGKENARLKFDLPYGITPYGAPSQANNGLIYGMTYSSGGGNFGEIFSYDISSGAASDLHDFRVATGGFGPQGALMQASNGLLYGMTLFGPDSINGRGMLFSYDISTGTLTDLHNFGVAFRDDGIDPYGSLIQASNGLLYGMTVNGGTGGPGTIFSFDISKDTEIVVHDFDIADGAQPYGKLMEANNGLLYGMTQYGGKYNKGVIFSYGITTGIETDVHDFGSMNDGRQPFGTLIQASNSILYGMTSFGGTSDSGTIFSYNIATGMEEVLHNFTGDTDGSYPVGSLIQASNGTLYGTTFYGGTNHAGTVVSYDVITNTETVVHDFGGTTLTTDGKFPTGDLIEADSFPVTRINQLPNTNYDIQIYPNPSSTDIDLKLALQQEQPVALSLFNTLGQQVWAQDLGKIQQIETTIPVTNLADGVYILKVFVRGVMQQKKVIVTR